MKSFENTSLTQSLPLHPQKMRFSAKWVLDTTESEHSFITDLRGIPVLPKNYHLHYFQDCSEPNHKAIENFHRSIHNSTALSFTQSNFLLSIFHICSYVFSISFRYRKCLSSDVNVRRKLCEKCMSWVHIGWTAKSKFLHFRQSRGLSSADLFLEVIETWHMFGESTT